jgi:DNA-binding transcriptional ArsR family regulator
LHEYYSSSSPALTTPVYSEANLHKLEQSLLKCIVQNPGIRYRELLRKTDSSNGVLSYHLAHLERSEHIRVDRKKGVTRYYPIHLSLQVSKIIGHIKHPTSRQLLSFLVHNGPCRLDELVQLTNKAPSTLSWHIKRLLESGVIERKHCVSSTSNRTFKSKSYDVTNKSLVLDVILNCKESFVDHVINNYSEIVDML